MNLLRSVADLLAGGPLTRADRPRWAAARTLRDLCDLTVEWLEGRIDSLPHYYGGVDVDEDDAPGLTRALVAANRAGFLTDASQAGYNGTGDDGAHWIQLAAVTGYADWTTVQRLRDRLPERYLFVVHTGLRRRFQRPARGVYVTWCDGEPRTGFGWQVSSGEIASGWDGCHPDAIVAVEAACTVTIYDPMPGENTLWAALEEAAR